MKKKSIGLIIGLMGFALTGVLAMQLYFLSQSYNMQSKLFDRTVNEALNNVVNKVARVDAINFLNEKVRTNSENDIKKSNYRLIVKSIHRSTLGSSDSFASRLTSADDSSRIRKRQSEHQRKIAMLRDSLRRIIMRNKMDDELFALAQEGTVNYRIRLEEFTDEFGIVHQRLTPEIVNVPSQRMMAKRKQKLSKFDTIRYEYFDPQFGRQTITIPQINPLWQREQARREKEKQIRAVKRILQTDSLENLKQGHQKQDVIMKIAEEYQRSGKPLTKRIDSAWIDSVLRFELRNKGIDLPFSYQITTANNDSLIFSRALNYGEKPQFLPANTYETAIFGKEVMNDPGKIRIAFPQKNSFLLSRMTATMATSGGLMFILVFCFGYTIMSILKQKKISEMKTDFINNMTHEFKTPVSTIMIASEALRDEEIAHDTNRVTKLANIIYEENARLGNHIERVLNIARIEKDDFKLDVKPIDVNDTIAMVLDSMELKLQKYNAHTELHLDAEQVMVNADELHFSNVLYNLVDNALKYSRNEPKITISTLNRSGQLVILVADEGIGMTRDQQTKIFEQFYRVPTGNLHDVKGFGLGLSYVNNIVKRLDGTITVRSEKDKGSEFELKFPLA
ncbi:HAMP domain-containing histidine kinase [Mucilaginibacter sp. RS28]|uniref:histidine kinase n=1 Tax=Mucilaginibacter straminoryzae TaxID=2932774 RepID=A0A9X1X6F3_9SPHI|nr:HAMP domain-containing sensor histidine kinase [Mucilaginibacter straminoryzae]MCJ8210523.1 HAMP domain-containing histidine kinase [Mucilaginibacter straminoryzae]